MKRYILRKLLKIPFLQKPLPKFPFGKYPIAYKHEYLNLFHRALDLDDSLVCKFEDSLGFSIDKEWWSELALRTQVVIKKSDLNFFHGRMLYSVLSKYILENNSETVSILETGTARGFSSICMARALIDNNCNGFITTIDCVPHNQQIYWNCISDCDGPSSRANLLKTWKDELNRIIFIQGWSGPTLEKLGLTRINFAFLDAQHTLENVLMEFNYTSERQKKGDIIVIDDVTPNKFQGVCDAINSIKLKNTYSIKELMFSEGRGYAIATKL